VADDPTAFPTLDATQIATLGSLGTHRAVAKGELLYREGDAAYDFYAVLSGEVEIVSHSPTERDGSKRGPPAGGRH
jgi:CRP-like cAMP-binding protein